MVGRCLVGYRILNHGSQSGVPHFPASPGRLLELQALRLHPTPTDLETLCFPGPSRGFWSHTQVGEPGNKGVAIVTVLPIAGTVEAVTDQDPLKFRRIWLKNSSSPMCDYKFFLNIASFERPPKTETDTFWALQRKQMGWILKGEREKFLKQSHWTKHENLHHGWVTSLGKWLGCGRNGLWVGQWLQV